MNGDKSFFDNNTPKFASFDGSTYKKFILVSPQKQSLNKWSC